MKKQTKIWLFAAAFALMLALAFTVGALAADEAPELDPTSPLYTPYGMIPEEYASVEDYPFVAFDSNGKCLGAAAILINDGNAGDPSAIFQKIWKKQGTYYIYMRADYTHSNGSFNISSVYDTAIVDLGGHTLTYTQSINVQLKTKGSHAKVTFKNGNMHAGANKTFLSQAVIASGDRVMDAHFTFENIRFSVYSGYTQNQWISYVTPTTTNTVSPKGYRTDLTVKNCTFDMTNVNRKIYIATVGHSVGQIASDVTLSGIHIKGSPKNFYLLNQSYTEDTSLTCVKNEEGHILTNTRLTTEAIPTHLTFNDENGNPMALWSPIATEGSSTTYALAPHARLTRYGWIPEEYFNNPEAYPILMFLISDGSIVYAGNKWGGETTTTDDVTTPGGVLEKLRNNSSKGNHAIYLQKDHKDPDGTSAYYNTGNITGNHIVDLNGHTLTATDIIFYSQAKNKNNTSAVTYTIQNGNIKIGSKILINIGSNTYDGDYGMTFNYIFDNVNITGIEGNTQLITDSAGGNFTTTTNVTFRDCSFTYANVTKKPLFNLGSTNARSHTVNIVLEGGFIKYPTNAFPKIFTSGTMENKTLTLTKGKNGYTEIITKGNTALTEGNKYQSQMGETLYFLDESVDGYETYRLATPSKYGYIPNHYLDATKYPILVFQKDLGYVTAGFDHLGGEGEAAGAWSYIHRLYGKDTYILLQADLTASQTNIYFNWGATYGTHIFDLNGHKMTLGDNLCQGQMKSKHALNFTFINGTIDVRYKNLVAIGAGESEASSSLNKETNILFENIKFIVANGYLVIDTNKGKFYGETNVEFKNCHFEITNAQTKPLCYLGVSSLYDIHVTFTGGTMNYQGENVSDHLQNNYGVAGHTVTYLPYNGAYTTVTTLSTVDMANRVYPSGDTVATLYKLSETENTITYRLTPYGFISAYLNLTNDLNLVYRAFVPALFTNPCVTFTVGSSTVTVTEYIVDDNGYYCYKLPNINPARMGETVTATLSATYGDQEMTRTHNTLSVKSYAEALKAQNGDNTALVSLVDALLVYGASAQQYLGQSAEDFVTSIGALADISAEENTLTMSGETSGLGAITYFGMNLDGAFSFRLGIRASVQGLTLVATQGDKVTTYNLDEYTAKDGIITVVYTGILANNLDTDVTFTLMQGDAVVGKTLTTNANSYLYRASIGDSETLATLAKALYAYGIAAASYAP